jgi:hypothetical protein
MSDLQEHTAKIVTKKAGAKYPRLTCVDGGGVMSKPRKAMKDQDRWSYPAREYEAAVGIRGIRGGWVLPRWLDITSRRHFARADLDL